MLPSQKLTRMSYCQNLTLKIYSEGKHVDISGGSHGSSQSDGHVTTSQPSTNTPVPDTHHPTPTQQHTTLSLATTTTPVPLTTSSMDPSTQTITLQVTTAGSNVVPTTTPDPNCMDVIQCSDAECHNNLLINYCEKFCGLC